MPPRWPAPSKALVATLLAVLPSMLPTMLLGAEQAAPDTLEQVVVTATQQASARLDLPLSAAVLAGRDLNAVRHVHVNELLQRAAGAWISRGNGQESLTALRSPVLTGPGSCGAFLMAGDGLPLRAPGFCNVNQLFDANTEQAAKIEVLKGPGTALYGSGAMHGLINVITPRPDPRPEPHPYPGPAPHHDPHPNPNPSPHPGSGSKSNSAPHPNQNQGTHHRWSIEAGPHGYRRGRYRLDATRGPQGLLLALNSADDGGYKRDSGFTQHKGSLRHIYTTGAVEVDSIFTFADLDQETAGFIQGHRAYRDSARKRNNPNPEAYRRASARRLLINITLPIHPGGEGFGGKSNGSNDGGSKGGDGRNSNGSNARGFSSLELVLTPYWRDNDMEFLQHFLPWQPVEENGAESLGLNAKLYLRRGNLNLAGGIDSDVTEGWLKEVQAQPFSPNQPAGVHYDYKVDALALGAWAQLDWDFAPRWRLDAGLRQTHNRYDYHNQTATGPACAPTASACRFYRPGDREDDYNNSSFNLGLLFAPHPQHRLFARAARGFRAPQATELYRLQGTQQRADLNAERLDSLELGLRGRAGGWGYELAAYHTAKDQVIFQDADRRNVSGASTTHRGLDIALHWRFAPGLDLALSASVQRHEYDGNINLLGVGGAIDGNRIDTAPDHFGSLRLGWDFRPGYRAELEWVHLGDYYLEPENRHRYSGHDLLNLRLSGTVTRHLHAGLRVTNLGDVDYAERGDFGFGNYRYFVGEERALYAHVEYRLPARE